MTNDGAGTSWDTNAPANSDARKDGAQEIRGLRKGLELRLEREHITLASSSVGGQHKEGSAMAYVDEVEPINKPDGATALDSDDEGRVWFNAVSKVLKIYDGTDFLAVSAIQTNSGSFTSANLNGSPETVDVGFAADLFIMVIDTTGGHGQFVVPLKNDATIAKVRSTVVGANLFLDFERSGTDVIVTKEGHDGTFRNSAQWMAFKFN